MPCAKLVRPGVVVYRVPARPADFVSSPRDAEFQYKWMFSDGTIHDEEVQPGAMLEIAATQLITDQYFIAVSLRLGEGHSSVMSEWRAQISNV